MLLSKKNVGNFHRYCVSEILKNSFTDSNMQPQIFFPFRFLLLFSLFLFFERMF